MSASDIPVKSGRSQKEDSMTNPLRAIVCSATVAAAVVGTCLLLGPNRAGRRPDRWVLLP